MPKTKKRRKDKRIRPHLVLTVAPEVNEATRESAKARKVTIGRVVEDALRPALGLPPTPPEAA
jgi:hypothetical protein